MDFFDKVSKENSIMLEEIYLRLLYIKDLQYHFLILLELVHIYIDIRDCSYKKMKTTKKKQEKERSDWSCGARTGIAEEMTLREKWNPLIQA